jgi:hypothetical protein
VSPANGATYPRNVSSITFTVEQATSASDTEIEMGSSPTIAATGGFADPVSGFYGLVSGASSGTYTWDPSEQAAGTYYWDASSFVCIVESFCGSVVSPVQSIVLTPLPAPAPVSPANGAKQGFSASTRFDFIPNAQPDDTGIELVFSSSNALSSDGVLAQPSHATADLTSEETGSTSKISVRIPAALDVPGTLYWQPVRVNCEDNPTPPCDVAGPVSSLTLTNKVAVTLGGNTTFRIATPRIMWTVSCNEACSGKVGIAASDSAFDLRPTRFSLSKAGRERFSYTYRGTALTQLTRAVSLHGGVELKVVATVSSRSGGGSATASRKLYIRPNPPPPGPDAGLAFSGSGSLNLGPITVPVNSYLIWACADCTIFTVESSSLGIFLDTFEQSSGQTYVDGGTYPNVEIFADGTWDISFVPAG